MLFKSRVDLAVRVHQPGQAFFVVVVEDRLVAGPVRVLLQPLPVVVPGGIGAPLCRKGLTIQMRVCRPTMGPVRSEIMAEVLPTPLGPRTMKLRCDSG